MSYLTVCGVDLSLTGAGVGVAGILDDEIGSELDTAYAETFGYDLKKPTLLTQLKRLDDVREHVLGAIAEARPDYLAIEEMPYGAKGQAVHQLAALWFAVAAGIRDLGIPFARVNVSKVKIYATGKGNQVGKDEVMLAIARRYPDALVANNNEADAFCLTAIAARKAGKPIEQALPQTHLRAMEGIEDWHG